MMMQGMKMTGQIPWPRLYLHGLVRAADGAKMSKSKGNVVDPLDTIEAHGCDALRFTLAQYATQGRDILWDEGRVEVNARFLNKIWQATRFALMGLEGYDPKAEVELGPYDHWIRARAGGQPACARPAAAWPPRGPREF